MIVGPMTIFSLDISKNSRLAVSHFDASLAAEISQRHERAAFHAHADTAYQPWRSRLFLMAK